MKGFQLNLPCLSSVSQQTLVHALAKVSYKPQTISAKFEGTVKDGMGATIRWEVMTMTS